MWNIYGASVAGKSHRDETGEIVIPCQDVHLFAKLSESLIFLIVCDGAGSLAFSQEGAAFCSKHILFLFEQTFENGHMEGILNDEEWRGIALDIFEKTLTALKRYALENGYDYNSMGCTINLAIVSSESILSAHIGDGRACFRDNEGCWQAFITPFKGDIVGSTVFLTSNYLWENLDECFKTRIISADGFNSVVLLSDGMERYCFSVLTKDENDLYYDPNLPFKPFMEATLAGFKKLAQEHLEHEVTHLFTNYLDQDSLLQNEYDDKTFLMAYK